MIPTHYLSRQTDRQTDRQTSRLFAVLLGACFVFSPAAHAQIEEIVVTAQKREEGVQDVSLAVSAVSGE